MLVIIIPIIIITISISILIIVNLLLINHNHNYSSRYLDGHNESSSDVDENATAYIQYVHSGEEKHRDVIVTSLFNTEIVQF
jgi:hypothetical protein